MRALVILGLALILVSIGGFLLTYSFLEENKATIETGRGILFPGPYDFNFLSSPGLRTIAYFFIAITILLTGLFILGISGVILLLMALKKKVIRQ